MTVGQLIAQLLLQNSSDEVYIDSGGGVHRALSSVEGGKYVVGGFQRAAPGSGGSPEAPEGTPACVVLRP